MKKSILLAVILTLGLSGTAFSAGTVTGATLTGVTIFSSIGDILFVSTNQTVETPASCGQNTAFQFAVDLTTALGQQTMALLLAARAAQTPISISGTGTCSVYSNVETINVVTF